MSHQGQIHLQPRLFMAPKINIDKKSMRIKLGTVFQDKGASGEFLCLSWVNIWRRCLKERVRLC